MEGNYASLLILLVVGAAFALLAAFVVQNFIIRRAVIKVIGLYSFFGV